MAQSRRSFLSFLGVGAAAAATAAVLPSATTTQAAVEEVAPAKLSDITPGSRYFTVLMNRNGQAVRTMMVDNLPQEIHIQMKDGSTSEFKLVSKDRYDGRTVEGLARYILWKGNVDWPVVKLGF